MDVVHLVMTLRTKTGVEVVETQQWQGITTLFLSSDADAQQVYDALVAEQMTVSPPVETGGERSVRVML